MFLTGLSPWPAHLVVVCVSIPLAIIDQATHRLPDAMVLPLLGGSFVYLVWLGEVSEESHRWVMATVAMAVTVLVLWLMAEFPGQPLGFGDVKLGGLVALHLGWHSPQLAVFGVAGAFVVAGLWVGGAWLAGRISLLDEVAFGPWLIVGFYGALFFQHVVG